MVGQRGQGDVAHALLVVQGAFGLVASVGLLVLMGFRPVYAVVPLAYVVLVMVLAGLVARRRRGAYVAVIVVEGLSLAGWVFNLALAGVPQLGFTVNLVGLLTTVALPVALIVLCGRALVER